MVLARLAEVGDKVIIMSYADFNEEEVKTFKPKVVFVDENNTATKITNYEKHGAIF